MGLLDNLIHSSYELYFRKINDVTKKSNPQQKKDFKNLAKQIDKTALQKIFKIIRKSL